MFLITFLKLPLKLNFFLRLKHSLGLAFWLNLEVNAFKRIYFDLGIGFVWKVEIF